MLAEMSDWREREKSAVSSWCGCGTLCHKTSLFLMSVTAVMLILYKKAYLHHVTLLLVVLLLGVSELCQFALSNFVLISETKGKPWSNVVLLRLPLPQSYLHSDAPGCYGSVLPISNHTSRGHRGFRQWKMNAYSLGHKTKCILRFEKSANTIEFINKSTAVCSSYMNLTGEVEYQRNWCLRM